MSIWKYPQQKPTLQRNQPTFSPRESGTQGNSENNYKKLVEKQPLNEFIYHKIA